MIANAIDNGLEVVQYITNAPMIAIEINKTIERLDKINIKTTPIIDACIDAAINEGLTKHIKSKTENQHIVGTINNVTNNEMIAKAREAEEQCHESTLDKELS